MRDAPYKHCVLKQTNHVTGAHKQTSEQIDRGLGQLSGCYVITTDEALKKKEEGGGGGGREEGRGRDYIGLVDGI